MLIPYLNIINKRLSTPLLFIRPTYKEVQQGMELYDKFVDRFYRRATRNFSG